MRGRAATVSTHATSRRAKASVGSGVGGKLAPAHLASWWCGSQLGPERELAGFGGRGEAVIHRGHQRPREGRIGPLTGSVVA
jgi:hypothetical protein